MTETVELPLWLVLVGGALAIWTLVSRLLLPGVRWFFRQRVNRLIDELNTRLHLKLPAVTLTKRQVLLDRLVYHPKVIAAVTAYCETEQVPRDAAMARVERYAREIVPAFNAYLYFRVASWMCKRVANLLYRVRQGRMDEGDLERIDPQASIVFVMNHRSNMDYIIVTYLAMRSTALSYAVGEWARVWPVQQLIRSMGAYFVRRGSGNPLYRRVLEAYVQMSVVSGITQAVFPEGGLSRDGCLREARIGLLDYMLRNFDPEGERDLVFIPVGLNYDRVLEDRTLLLDTDPAARRPSPGAALRTAFKFIGQQLWMMLRGRWYRNGYACVNVGTPLSMRSYLGRCGWDPRKLRNSARRERVMEFASDLMSEVARLVPVLPVSVVCYALLEERGRRYTSAEITRRAIALMTDLESSGAYVHVPRNDYDYAVESGLRMLRLRRFLVETEGRLQVDSNEEAIVSYYANAIAHLIPRAVDTPLQATSRPA